MNDTLRDATEIVTLIIGVAIVAVLVSGNAQTSNVIKSAGDALASILSVAVSPVTSSNSVGSASTALSNVEYV